MTTENKRRAFQGTPLAWETFVLFCVVYLFAMSASFKLEKSCLRGRPRQRLASLDRRFVGVAFARQKVDDDSDVGENGGLRSASNKANGDASGRTTRKRRRRSVDFPPFAYDADSEYGKNSNMKQEVVVRFQCDEEWVRLDKDPGRDRVYRTMTSRVVSVPRRKEPKELGWKRIARSILGPAFEAQGTFDAESLLPSARQTRLLKERAYARSEPFAAENITVPPSLNDLAARTREPFEGFWISAPARILSFGISYFSFPYLTQFLDNFVTMSPSALDEITSKFAPGISILYGTFISLTLSILYNRQRDIQDNVAIECSLITTVTRTLLSLFRDTRERAIDAGQCAADQIRILVRGSRGAELMLLMYSDPYARMLELVDKHEEEVFRRQGNAGSAASRIASARDVLKDLNKLRANRLSDESLALPPTHFLILNILTGLILLGYTISILPTVAPKTGEPSNESSLLFGFLTSIYVLFFNFASDLNNPFQGVYQVRRSCAASHLLEAKWLIANHPLLQGEVDFEDGQDDEETVVEVRSPGLGDFWFERDELFVRGDQQQQIE